MNFMNTNRKFITKVSKFCWFFKRLTSTITAESQTAANAKPKRHKVFIFESTNVFANLAIEHWLYENSLSEDNVLLLWRNKPCVVIGRHQNPWVECDLNFARWNNISIARRQSGGGAVYHDLGNLNCTFLTPRQSYDKKANLKLIVDALKEKWNLNVSISGRDDILLDGDSKTDILSNATASISSKVKLLSDVEPRITFKDLTSTISQRYIAHNSLSEKDIHRINPDEGKFVGLKNIEDNLSSWKWIFAKTPKFTVDWSFPTVLNNSMNAVFNVKLDIEKGRVNYFEHELVVLSTGEKIGDQSPLKPFLVGMELSDKGFNECYNVDKLKPSTSQYNRDLYDKFVQELMLRIKRELIY
ncbi:lipoyl amidotransferase LIPT1, mitochondrial-like [Tubulanus polymorphus]|uniref:lipoyl amidotransferase LIPT1, mitochondrial-like n=1 Tax=Tubulanus polymorphus TaxID=672921 RepID=UPI003DA5DD4C